MPFVFRLIDTGVKIVGWTLVIILGHAVWFFIKHECVVPQRCGAALVILGVVVAARGFLREGVRAAVDREMPRSPGVFPLSHETLMAFKERSEARRSEIEKDVRAEREWAFWLIVIGTGINGYGDLLVSVVTCK